MRKKTEIITLINNEDQYNKLITKSYKLNNSVNLYFLKIEQVDLIYQIECLRQKDNYMYTIIKLENNVLLFILFEESNNEYIVKDFWYFKRKIFLEEYMNLKPEKSTIVDVKKIDSYGNFVLEASSIGPTSFHYTFDGYIVKITYEDNNVSEITYYELDANSIIYKMLPIDKESLPSIG